MRHALAFAAPLAATAAQAFDITLVGPKRENRPVVISRKRLLLLDEGKFNNVTSGVKHALSFLTSEKAAI